MLVGRFQGTFGAVSLKEMRDVKESCGLSSKLGHIMSPKIWNLGSKKSNSKTIVKSYHFQKYTYLLGFRE